MSGRGMRWLIREGEPALYPALTSFIQFFVTQAVRMIAVL